MRAAVFHELGKPLQIETVSKPQAGRGEIVHRLAHFAPLSAVLVNPLVPVPADKTRQVFQRLAAPWLTAPDVEDAKVQHDVLANDGLSAETRNDLEAPATALISTIADVLAALRADPRTQTARLSGAGPTCFALTATVTEAQSLAADLVRRQPTWWVRATQLR